MPIASPPKPALRRWEPVHGRVDDALLEAAVSRPRTTQTLPGITLRVKPFFGPARRGRLRPTLPSLCRGRQGNAGKAQEGKPRAPGCRSMEGKGLVRVFSGLRKARRCGRGRLTSTRSQVRTLHRPPFHEFSCRLISPATSRAPDRFFGSPALRHEAPGSASVLRIAKPLPISLSLVKGAVHP